MAKLKLSSRGCEIDDPGKAGLGWKTLDVALLFFSPVSINVGAIVGALGARAASIYEYVFVCRSKGRNVAVIITTTKNGINYWCCRHIDMRIVYQDCPLLCFPLCADCRHMCPI
jgi:hypothetical protein